MSTISTVAKEAGVAPSTVSRVINGAGYVREETRFRVQAAVKQLGYKSRRPGRPSNRATKVHVAIIYSRNAIRDGQITALSRAWINGVRRKLADTNAHVSVLACLDSVDRDPMFQQGLQGGDYDGMILIGPEPEDGYLQRVVEARRPAVVFNRPPRHDQWSCVTVDYYGGGEQAAVHLMELGHRRIAILYGAQWQGEEIHAGQLAALKAAGVSPVLDEPFRTSWGITDDFDLWAQRILDAKATGVLLAGGRPIVRLADALERCGARVPQDLSLVDFDELGLVTASGLRPTSVSYDKEMMGMHAAGMLLRLLKPSTRVRSMTLSVKTRLFVGQTTRRVP